MNNNIACVILAGGKSSRMQEDKALMPFKEYNTLAQYQYNRLSKIFKHCFISTKTNKFNFECSIILDNYKTYSPLHAFVSIFEQIETNSVFIISVDMPFFSHASINKLIKEHSKEVTLYSLNNKIEPLGAIYEKSSYLIAKEMLKKNDYILKKFINKLDKQIIVSTQAKDFINLNYKSDYLKYFNK